MLGRDFCLGGDNEVNAASGFGAEEVVDTGGAVVGIKIVEGEGFLDGLGARAGHATIGREVSEGVGEDGHLDVELGAIGIGAALGEGEVSFFGLVADGFGGGAAVEEALDVSGLDDVEAHEISLLDHGGEDAVLVAGV